MLDQRIKFRHLQTFIEVARQASVGKAARVLTVSQPAVTRTMRELEAILGVELVEKDGRGIKVTRTGEVFLRHAGASVAAARKGVDAIEQHMNATAPPVRVGCLPSVSAGVMPVAVGRFLEGNSGSRIRIVTGENTVLLQQLRTGDLDLVMGRLAAPEQMNGLSFEPLYRETVVFAVRHDHPLMHMQPFSLAAIERFPVLMPPEGSVIRPFVDRFLVNNGVSELKGRIETVSDSFARTFLRTSDAVWIISRGGVANDLATGAVATLPLDTSETVGSVGLTTRPDIEAGASATIFMTAVREVATAFSRD